MKVDTPILYILFGSVLRLLTTLKKFGLKLKIEVFEITSILTLQDYTKLQLTRTYYIINIFKILNKIKSNVMY